VAVQLGSQIASKVQTGSLVSKLPRLQLPDKPSIAVLPFQNMSGDVEQEYSPMEWRRYHHGTIEIQHRWFVIARNSSFTYKGKAVDIKQVGRELGVRMCWKAASENRAIAFALPAS